MAAMWMAGLLLLAWPPRNAVAQVADADPPSRVARLADLAGNVWVYHPDAGDWVQATLNLPITTGDTLATEAGARAELQVGSSTLRLDSGSELEVSTLDDSRISLQLRGGALAVRVRNLAETGPFEIGTDEGRFRLLGAGRYRIDRGTGSSFVAVDSGQVRYEYASSALTVSPGQRAEFWLDAGGTAQYGLGGMTYDAFTAWNNERDRAGDRIGNPVASQYVSPEMTGVQDLDRYGSWEPTAEYGAVWIPTAVAADWVPYSTGRWAWVRPWGWTWVDDAPWGFAPFHYGRWVNLRNRWCWTPGVREPRPVYAPALVGWVGPPRGALTAGVGPAVGWFPLAPREVFVPGYRSSPRYIRDLNTPYVRRGDNISIDIAIRNPQAPRDFENRHFPRAVTVVPATVFGERRSLAPVAAQYRDAPWARDFARSNGPAPVLAAPSVTPPPSFSNRGVDTRPSRPPPGFNGWQAAGAGRPSRDRDAPRSEPPQANGAAAGTGTPVDPQRPPGGGDPRYGRPPGTMPASPPTPYQTSPQFLPQFSPPTSSANPTPGQPPAGARPAPPLSPAAQPGEASPRMRAFPVNRGGERRESDGRFGDGGRSQPQPQPQPQPQFQMQQQQPQPQPGMSPREGPAPAPRPVERPVERPVFAPAPTIPAPAPAPAPVAPMPVQAVRPPAPVLAPPVPVGRPAEPAGQPHRVEGARPAPPPAAEPQRPAVAPERRNDPNPSR